MKSVVMKIKLDDGARMPEKAHATDVGYDICSPIDVVVPAHRSVFIDSGVHIQTALGYCRGSDIQERSECQARHYLNNLDKTERGDGGFGSTGK